MNGRRKVKKEKKSKSLALYDTKGYYRDLDYIARLSYIPEHTRSWIESKMYELRESANKYERGFGELLINNNIEFVHQAPFVFRPNNIYFCDFYLPLYRIAIEIDGIYHNSPLQIEKDSERDANFKSIGIRVLRIANEEVNDKHRLLLRLCEFINIKGINPSTTNQRLLMSLYKTTLQPTS